MPCIASECPKQQRDPLTCNNVTVTSGFDFLNPVVIDQLVELGEEPGGTRPVQRLITMHETEQFEFGAGHEAMVDVET